MDGDEMKRASERVRERDRKWEEFVESFFVVIIKVGLLLCGFSFFNFQSKFAKLKMRAL
jgi:hypothetical protein